MQITKHQADNQGHITIHNVVRLLTMGLQNNVVTIWATTANLQEVTDKTIPVMSFHVKKDGDTVVPEDNEEYISSYINDTSIQHLFLVKPTPSS